MKSQVVEGTGQVCQLPSQDLSLGSCTPGAKGEVLRTRLQVRKILYLSLTGHRNVENLASEDENGNLWLMNVVLDATSL